MTSRATMILSPLVLGGVLFWALAAWQASPDGRPPTAAVPLARPLALSVEAPLRSLPSASNIAADDAAVTPSSAWRLLGVVRAVKGSAGLAVLQGSPGVVTLRLGARTEDGWRLEQLRPDGADLRGPDGQIVTLSLPKPSST